MFFITQESERVVKVNRKEEKEFAKKVREITNELASVTADDSKVFSDKITADTREALLALQKELNEWIF